MDAKLLRVVFEKTINDRTYQVTMPLNAPLGECYDVVWEALNTIVAQSKSEADKMQQTTQDQPTEVKAELQ